MVGLFASLALGAVFLLAGGSKIAAGAAWPRQAAELGAPRPVALVLRLAQGRRPPCACFGAWSATPIGWGHVARNAVFAAFAAVAIAAG